MKPTPMTVYTTATSARVMPPVAAPKPAIYAGRVAELMATLTEMIGVLTDTLQTAAELGLLLGISPAAAGGRCRQLEAQGLCHIHPEVKSSRNRAPQMFRMVAK